MLGITYKEERVAALLETAFVFLVVDTDAHPKVARHYGIASVPAARVLAPDGTELARYGGFKSANAVLAILRPLADGR